MRVAPNVFRIFISTERTKTQSRLWGGVPKLRLGVALSMCAIAAANICWKLLCSQLRARLQAPN